MPPGQQVASLEVAGPCGDCFNGQCEVERRSSLTFFRYVGIQMHETPNTCSGDSQKTGFFDTYCVLFVLIEVLAGLGRIKRTRF